MSLDIFFSDHASLEHHGIERVAAKLVLRLKIRIRVYKIAALHG